MVESARNCSVIGRVDNCRHWWHRRRCSSDFVLYFEFFNLLLDKPDDLVMTDSTLRILGMVCEDRNDLIALVYEKD
jgi:hypothetical protein